MALLSVTGVAGPTASAQTISDPLFPAQWNLAQIGAPAAWARSTGAGVTIGIVDTGVLSSHEDLVGKVLASTTCIGAKGNPNACAGRGEDDNGHGTHVAGIAAAARNGRGIVGVAPNANLVVAKVLNYDEGGTIADVEAGIRWVVRHGAQVVNLSIGDNSAANAAAGQLSFHGAIEEAWNAGAVPVVAAGNPNALGPARESFNVHALVVGATGPSGGVAYYSNALSTATWGLVAPGGAGTSDGRDVMSSYWLRANPASTTSYIVKSGASMAVAHVTGAVALLLAEGLNRDQAVQRVLDTASHIGCGAGCHGRLNAAAAVALPAPVAAPATVNPARPPAAPPAPAGGMGERPPTTPAAPPATAGAPASADPGSDAGVGHDSATEPASESALGATGAAHRHRSYRWWAAPLALFVIAAVTLARSVRTLRGLRS